MKMGRMFKCRGYRGHVCENRIRRASSSQRRCILCAKEHTKILRKAWNKIYYTSSVYKKRRNSFFITLGGRLKRKIWGNRYHSTFKSKARRAKKERVLFLRILGLSANYDVRKLVLNLRISVVKLEETTQGYGWPDFEKEALEEKGPKLDYLNYRQWARAILEYRAGRRYKVAWRFTSTRRKVFETVFDFYDWQIMQGEIE